MIYDEWGGFFDHVVPPRVPDLRQSRDLAKDFGQMGFRIPAVVVSPYARRGHVDHSIYGFESIIKMIRYRYGLPPLTPRDLYANNIAAAFDFDSKPNYTIPDLPTPPEVIVSQCAGTAPLDSGGAMVSQPCTAAAGRYDRDRAALARAQKQRRRSKRPRVRRRLKNTVAARTRTVARDRRRAIAACGRGVPL